MSKKLSQCELLEAVEAKQREMRGRYRDLQTITNPQEREMAQYVLGQLAMLDDVRQMLRGFRRSFI